MATRRPIQRSRPEEEDGGPPPDIFDLMAGPGDETWDLANMGAAELLGPAGPFAQAMPGYQARPGQMEMARAVAETAKLREEIPYAAAEASWVVATDLAEALSRGGLAFHQAHVLVGRLVLESTRSGKKPSDWTPESLVQFDEHFTPEMAKYLNPSEGMKTRELPGGTGPAHVARALAAAEARLSQMKK